MAYEALKLELEQRLAALQVRLEAVPEATRCVSCAG